MEDGVITSFDSAFHSATVQQKKKKKKKKKKE